MNITRSAGSITNHLCKGFLLVGLAVVLSGCGGGSEVSTPTHTPGITRISVATDGSQADSGSYRNAISGDGNVIAFRSTATNLSPFDNTGTSNIFMHNRSTGATSLVSVGISGPADGSSYDPSVDSTGRFIAFQSGAGNLVAGDTNGFSDIFVRDTSGDNTFVASTSLGGGQADDDSYNPAISGDGRYVAFESYADNLALPQRGSHSRDVFVRDTVAGITYRASVASDNSFSDGSASAPGISLNGKVVAFDSNSTNLVANDNNGFQDVFVRDLDSFVTERVSVAWDHAEGNDGSYRSSISEDGRYVAFRSQASNLVQNDNNGVTDIFVRDRLLGETEIVSVSTSGEIGNGESNQSSISADGRFVVFQSYSSNLVPDDTNGVADIFLRDRVSGTTRRINAIAGGAEADDWSGECRISADGTVVSFQSRAGNLVTGDTNGVDDVFTVLW